MPAAGHSSVQMHKRYVNLKGSDVAEAFGLSHTDLKKDAASYQFASVTEMIIGGVGERLKPPVLKTGVHFVDREFESRPLRQFRRGERPAGRRPRSRTRW